MTRVFDCHLSLVLHLPEFKLVFYPALAEKEFDKLFWKKNELILVHKTYKFSEKSWTQEEMKFNKEGGFTVQDTLDAICTSQKHFRRKFQDPDHVYFEGFTKEGPNKLSIFWGS